MPASVLIRSTRPSADSQPRATAYYSALQAQIQHRFSNGLMFNVNYTWSHMTDNQDSSGWGSKQGTTVWQNAYDPSANHGAANFDIRHMFKAYGTYDLPFGPGRKFLNGHNALDECDRWLDAFRNLARSSR